jgi:basic membrane lipoprotein Med (substrate-binding protein (PBP1-ABC) superfamily)/DNA-binding SARP family transcriptional activator
MMEFGILGPLEARSDGVPVDLGPHKQRALLALLLLHADRVVSTDRILEALWGEDADGKEKALWVHISRLRSALEPHRVERGQSSVLITRDHGYLIRTDPDTVDAHRFEAAVGQASARLKDDPDGAAEILRTALGLWRGSALQDFAYDEFAQAEITRLEEMRLGAIETRIDADLRRGLASELIPELETLVHQHPLRERPVGQLMHAFYRAGRQAEALRAFQRFRRGIGEELGIEPSPELRRLEEQILLHDPRLVPAARRAEIEAVTNPFKGLRAFQESDAEDFFGRERLVAQVVTRLTDGGRLVALVGPSGSGKSSVARAGVVPALRKGAVPGSERWLVASMVPGTHPFAELEAALLRSTIDAPDSLDAQLADPTLGILRAALRLLPEDTRLVLVIDQFEELFTLVDDEQDRRRFLDNLVAAIDDSQGRVLVVLTLRADAYHRPLAYGEFAARLGPGVINVLPLTTDELEEAAEQPAARRSVAFEPALLAELLTDVIGEPGALPVFQYALTELFDRRDDDRLTLSAYHSMGGVRGALSRRADDLYHRLTLDEQEAARQLFLRLVTIADGEQWGRRRVPASEIVAMDVDVVTMESVIDQFGRHRFLAFDRDHGTGAPTVEVAHEALLSEWDRLRGWIEEGRLDITRCAALAAALAEWNEAQQDSDYLLGGNRLADYERWRASTSMRLTTAEQEYLDASVVRRDVAAAAESARVAREAGLARRARRRWWALVAVVGTLAVAAVAVLMFAPGERPEVGLVTMSRGKGMDALLQDGFERAARDFDFEPILLTGPFNNLDDELGSLAESGTDLVVLTDLVFFSDAVEAAAEHPDTTWAYVEHPAGNVPSISFAEHEGSYLVGAAAALTSQTGTIGFVGGFQIPTVERFRAGFEAGARAVDPAVEILAAYTSLDGTGFADEDLANEAATRMYQRGADVVFHATGAAGGGVFAAAREESDRQGRHLWAIGVDADQYLDASELERPHVLTSMIKRFDVAVYELIRDYLDGGLEPTGRVLTLADGGVGYSTTGGHLTEDTIATLERLKQEIIAGTRTVPRSPKGELEPPPDTTVADTVTITYDGATCRAARLPSFEPGDVARVEFVNTSRRDALLRVQYGSSWVVGITAAPGSTNMGYASFFTGGDYTTYCAPEPSDDTDQVPGPTLTVTASNAVAPEDPLDAATEEIARAFLDAYGAFDADRAITYLSYDAIAETWGSPEEFRLEIALREAQGYKQMIDDCDRESEGDRPPELVRCTFDLHALRSDEIGLGPYVGNHWDFTVRDGKIVSVSSTWAFMTNGFAREMWEPFANWVAAEHPDDVARMYEDPEGHIGSLRTEESIRLWDQRTREYVEYVTADVTERDG